MYVYCISSIKVGPQLYMSDGCCIHHSSFTTHSPTTGGSHWNQLWLQDQMRCNQRWGFRSSQSDGGGSRNVVEIREQFQIQCDSWIFMVFSEHLDGMSIQMAGLDHDVLRIHIGGMIPATSFDLDTYSYGCFICPAANCAQNH